MPSSDTNATKPPSVAGRSNNKSSKQSKMIVLKVPSTLLDRFPGIPAAPEAATTTKDAKPKEASSSSSPTSTTPPVVQPSSADNASDTASTPAAPADPSVAAKGLSGPKPGAKRTAPGTDTATPKPRGKPGPKKKAKLEDGTEVPSRPSGSGHGGSHRLGPKANQGAINAGLRALDRTGKPCRKWERKSFQLKSFTGVTWGVPSWRAPPKPKPAEESSNNTNNTKEEVAPPAGDADSKANQNGVSAAQSEKSNSGEGGATPFPSITESSPAPFVSVAS